MSRVEVELVGSGGAAGEDRVRELLREQVDHLDGA